MSIISLADWVSAVEAESGDELNKILRDKFPKPAAEEVSPCCNKPVNYSLGKGNPVCSECTKPIYS